MARTYRVEEIAQLFGKQLAANATYQIGTAGTSKAPGQTIRVNGISARAETTIASGSQVLLVKSGGNWFAYGQPQVIRNTKTRARRRRVTSSPPTGAATILYRVDNVSDSELWLYEGGSKVLLGTYPVTSHPFNEETLFTHVAGVRDVSGAAYQFLSVFADTDTRIIRPVRLLASAAAGVPGSPTEDRNVLVEFTDNVGASLSSSANLAGQGSANASTTSGFLGDAFSSTSATDRASASAGALVNFQLPNGEWSLLVDLTATNSDSSQPGADGSSASNTLFFFGLSAASATTSDVENPAVVQIDLPFVDHGWVRTRPIYYGTQASSRSGRDITAADGTSSGAASVTTSIALSSYRPSAYLSKARTTGVNQRYIGVFFLDSDGLIKTDYYTVGPDLSFSKQTWDYGQIPDLNINDLNRSLLTYSYDDWIFDNLNPYWARGHTSNRQNNNYNIQPNGTITNFTSYENAATNPGLTALIANKIPEADRILWVAAFPREARRIDPGGHTVTKFPLKQS